MFGSNPEGRHGAGAAKVARDKFAAEIGTGAGLTGMSYAIPTKDLRIKGNRSISQENIIDSIREMYDVAERMSRRYDFYVAYRNVDETSLNGYTGIEMINMFKKAGPIPKNVIFSWEWISTGLFDRI